jgi:hypothetical protein
MSRRSRLNPHPPAVVVRVAARRLVVHRQVAALVPVPVAAVKAVAQFPQLPEARRLPHLPVLVVAALRVARQFRQLRAPLQRRAVAAALLL